MLANALQRYLGMGFDGAAQMAADLWDQEAGPDRVRSAKYADDHDLPVFPPPVKCSGCGDEIHQPSGAFPGDRCWFDSSGDPQCWANGDGPHVSQGSLRPCPPPGRFTATSSQLTHHAPPGLWSRI
jgi:hypothetical protein